MTKYFLDFEFIEGYKKPVRWLPSIPELGFNKRYHTIQLVSIGLVDEGGRSYYAISTEFDARDASDWVKQHVLAKLPPRIVSQIAPCEFFGSCVEHVPNPLYKTNKEIAADVIAFVEKTTPEFWGYYADYDWVVFCTNLFGRMIDLPKGFPMYCRDLKQLLDETVAEIVKQRREEMKPFPVKVYDALKSEAEVHEYELARLKQNPYYPTQAEDEEHNAEGDAQWNRRLHNFLKQINQALNFRK